MNPDPKPLLNTLPGDIPGLLRRGSPLRVRGARTVAVVLFDGRVAYATKGALDDDVLGAVALDLTDPTGRAHAAWWALDRDGFGIGLDHGDLIEDATQGADMIPEEIDALAHLVLRLAGREAP